MTGADRPRRAAALETSSNRCAPHRRSAAPSLLLPWVLFLGAGCTPWEFSLDECDETCGAGPFFLLDSLEFVQEQPSGLEGFDLDGRSEDCGVDDGTSPSGAGGVDNQFGSVWDVLPDAVATVIPVAIETSLQSGAMMVVLELVGHEDLTGEGPAGFVLREGSGDLLVGADARPLAGQTIDLAPGDNLLGSAETADVEAGALHADGLTTLLKLEYIDTQVEFRVVRGRATLTPDGEGGVNLIMGGVVPLDAVMELVYGLGGDGDANIRAALEALVPLLVDARTTPDGACDGISGAFRGHAVPTYLFGS